jgi:hypothetical protein|tara:strand:- start:39 stop:512 length:474 start_codon:yes stop_codon:yes gene_type:complete
MKDIKFNVGETTIRIKEIGKLKAFDNQRKVLSFLVECDKDNESINFIFYNSIHFTEEYENKKSQRSDYSFNEKERRSLIYDILACIDAEYHSEVNSFDDFLDGYGYEYSKDNKILYYKVLEQYNKLHKVFNDEQVKDFNENDDILKNFVDKLEYERV